MIKLHIASWQFLAGVLVLGALGACVSRRRELTRRLRLRLMEPRHSREDVAVRSCVA